jgi:hypothetical protein
VLIAVGGAIVDITDLSRSQIAFAWSSGKSRVLVVLSIGAGLGVAVGSLVTWCRDQRVARAPHPTLSPRLDRHPG